MAKRSTKSVRPSENDIESVTWQQVFEKTAGIPTRVQRRIIKEDDPPSNLHNFMKGTHERIMQLITGEYFKKVDVAVKEIVDSLGSKRCRFEFELLPPSDYAKAIVAKEEMCDHRFFSDLHISLQVQAFGNFIESMKSKEDVDAMYFRVAATLMQNMSQPFSDEASRVDKFKSIVKDLGELFTFQSQGGQRQGYQTDCTVVTRNNVPIANWEFKNEFFRNATCPVSQNNAYFAHLQKTRSVKDRSPMLLVSVVGCHHLQVFGAVWNGERCVCIDPLYHPISLLFVPRDPTYGVSLLAQLLSVMDKAMGELIEYYDKSLKERISDCRGPYWTDNGCLRYKQRLVKSVKWLFEATYNEEKVVVKFARGHYGEAVHKLLGDAGFAPKLITCKSLPGGWRAVVMEKLEGCDIYCSTDITDTVKQSLEAAINLMHSHNYVHGDLRPQNILIVNKTIRILDFDWADIQDTAKYPPELNMNKDCDWHPDVKPGGKILKVHDKHLIDSLVNMIS